MAQSLATSTREQVDAAIRETLLDYVLGWYDGDPVRMERSIHPELAKRIVRPNDRPWPAWPPGDRLDETSALTLLRMTRRDPTPAQERNLDTRILDRFENTASVKIFGDAGEYAHMAFCNGRWVIGNVLWGLRPNTDGKMDDAAITETALDYIESCYDGDGARMERSLHPELAKRIVVPHGGTTGDRLENMSALRLVQGIRAGGGNWSPERRSEVTILDRVENAASVRVDATTWIDYMHLAKWNGRWAIVNVLWAQRPKPEAS